MPALKRAALLLFLSLVSFCASARADPFGFGLQLQQNNVKGASGGCSYTPPLDAITATAAFSFRVLKTNWIGQNLVKIQRSSDSTQKTFTTTAPNCALDTTDAFFDGSTYTVVTWYDQSGNGNDVTQATNGNRPTVTLSCQNGFPCAVFTTASSQRLNGTLSSAITAGTFVTVEDVTSVAASMFWGAVDDGTANNGLDGGYSSASTACAGIRVVGGVSKKGTIACSVNTWHSLVVTLNNTITHLIQDGVAGTDETSSVTLASVSNLRVGSTVGGASNFFAGKIAEYTLFAPDISNSNAGTVSTNQKAYWGTP